MENDDQQPSTSWAMQLGNLPAHPKNGLMKTYDNPQRTFTRPYSAKTVFFYKEGDVYFTGVRIPVSKHRYKTFESLVEELNHQIYMPFGVRNITTPMGRNQIDSLDQLEHLGKYVASSSKPPRGLDFGVVEKVQAALRSAQRSTRSAANWAPGSPTIPQKMRMSRMLGITIPAKEVRFVLNGKGQYYRTMISPIKPPTMDQLLEEISAKLGLAIYRLFTDDGRRIMTVDEILTNNSSTVIACPRNERPFLNASVKLPEIKPSRYAPRMAYSKLDSSADTSSASASASISTGSLNGIEKRTRAPQKPRPLPRVANLPSKKPADLPAGGGSNYWTHKYIQNNNDAKNNKNNNSGGNQKIKEATSGVVRNATKNRGGKLARKVEEVDSGTGNSINSSWHTSEASESSRAESMTERKAQMIREEQDIEEDAEDSYHGGIHSSSGSEVESDEPDVVRTPESAIEVEDDDEEEDIVKTPESELPSRIPTRDDRREREDLESPAVETPDVDEEKSRSATADGGTRVLPTPSTAPMSGRSRTSTANLETPSRGPTPSSQRTLSSPAIQTPDSTPKSSRKSTAKSDREEILPSDPEDDEDLIPDEKFKDLEREELAATKIQAAYRGFRVRKNNRVNLSQNIPEDEPEETKILDEENDEEGSSLHSLPPGHVTYTIEVRFGHRFGAETEANLYIIINGDDAKSNRILLNKNVDWLTTPQNEDSRVPSARFHVDCPNLGTLNKITIGHDRFGYNAGTHIEEVIITENKVDGRQYLFYLNKWLDGGQVDGKIERSAFLATFAYLMSSPIKTNAVTLGRFEFMFHTRKDELGGTTSNIRLIGVGDLGTTTHLVQNDKVFREYQHNPLIQLDFDGDRPNYYIEFVEIKDLDTDERCVAPIGKWLLIEGDNQNKKYQPFREFPFFRKSILPLRAAIFEGKITIGDTSLCSEKRPIIDMQFLGIDGRKSGKFPAVPVKLTNGKIGYSFRSSFFPRLTQFGKDVLLGLNILQQIYDQNEVSQISVGNDLFIKEVVVRETNHSPYRQHFRTSWARILEDLEQEERNDMEEEEVMEEEKKKEDEVKETYIKTLTCTSIEGLPTTKKLTKEDKESEPTHMHFVLFMSIAEPDNFSMPKIEILPKNGDIYEMIPINEDGPENAQIGYELELEKNIGLIERIRIRLEELEAGKTTFINKMRLVEMETGTEVRFSLFSEVREFEVVEMMCVYPDIAPKYSIIYCIQITTIKSKGSFRPYISISGADGDTGYRAYPGLTEFPEDTNLQMEIEALRLGSLKNLRVYAKNCGGGAGKMSWKFSIKIAYHDNGDTCYYTTDVLNLKKADQEISTDLSISDGADYIEL
ncbi:unnamed protein product [Caenorhabditis angaria]|uniref:Doublecortin domain-containing protein n=1 Tax=Caenorhabditis angaria TaxID=860376 RepID=A0A9P1MSE0_9PELO|nr:unnamed protein product [Caenorhabditis angaria]